ncbi:GNAT family N-acetyltransferase [Geomicrobium sp. JSM 1781026]|uniref:GNAT family N-acetyltransferase n=1 Tax=Geomicrobium sp. JSM 1781026 TaxID=3344580 RepID=UPI0035BF6E43
MTTEVTIQKAEPTSSVGAKLNAMALNTFTKTVVGSNNQRVIDDTMLKLWRARNNRFSHEYAYVAKEGNRILGLMTCYPAKTMDRLLFPTAVKILRYRHLGFLIHSLKNRKDFRSMLRLKEAKEGEFHIGTLAMLPESRGKGIGTMLIHKAEQFAREQGLDKLSLTVDQNNPAARKLYERVGFHIVHQSDQKPFAVYRMVKQVDEGAKR